MIIDTCVASLRFLFAITGIGVTLEQEKDGKIDCELCGKMLNRSENERILIKYNHIILAWWKACGLSTYLHFWGLYTSSIRICITEL